MAKKNSGLGRGLEAIFLDNGRACVYNIDVMEETTDNIAVGANAVSKRVFDGGARIERFASQKDLKTYMEKLDETIKNRLEFFTKQA